jgi:sulfatase maturation enzyme AslB (radical SAM superfamily)
LKLTNPEIRIETTNHCNAECIICPREKMTRPKVVMDYGHFHDLIKQGKQLGATDISVFGYGEPLLDRDLWYKVFECKKLNLDTYMTTNGSLLNREAAFRLLNSGLSHIQFSVHGFGPNYERVHKGLDWGSVTQNIYDFIKINDDNFDHSCIVAVSVIPMHGEEIKTIRDFWEDETDFLEIWKPHGWAGGRKYRKVNRKKKTCGRPFRGPVQIQADGKMIVCCFDTNGELEVGDTHKQTIEEILKGDRFNEIREAHTTGNHDGLICQWCDQLNIEDKNPLLYSNRDVRRKIGATSSTKFKLEV